jgi:hypothetical protein
VKPESAGSVEEPGKDEGSGHREPRTCPVCGTKFFATADREFHPVCILNKAFGAESAATGVPGSASGSAAAMTEEADGGSQLRRFENYEVMLDAAGRPIELGRGAMGVTYKALDVDLRCPVTLEVISERCLGTNRRASLFTGSVRHTAFAIPRGAYGGLFLPHCLKKLVDAPQSVRRPRREESESTSGGLSHCNAPN